MRHPRNAMTSLLALGLLAIPLGIGCNRGPATEIAKESASSADGHEEHRNEEGHEEHGAAAPITLSETAQKNAGIRVEAATLHSLAAARDVPGIVEVAADRATKITPPAPGKILQLLAKPGDLVHAGQTLAVLDSFEVAQAHAAVQQAEAGIQQAEAALQTAQAEASQSAAGTRVAAATVRQAQERRASARQALSRQKELAAAGAFAQAPLQAAQAELSRAQSELIKSQTELQSHLVALQRAERLFKEEILSKAELEQAQLENRQDQANVERASRQVDAAQQTLTREQRIAQAGLLNAREIQTAEAALRDTEADVQKAASEQVQATEAWRKAERGVQAARTALTGARALAASAQTNLYALEGSHHMSGQGGRLVVTAPIAGVVAERAVTPGEAVERADVLFTLQNTSVIQITAQVPEAQIGAVRIGQRASVTVAAFPRLRFSGTVQSVGSQVDDRSRSLPVRLLVSNAEGRLKPRMFARVALGTGAARKVMVVPDSALVEMEGKPHVFVEEDGKFEERPVTLGVRSGSFVEVRSGLKAGERVVIAGTFALKSEASKESLAGHEH